MTKEIITIQIRTKDGKTETKQQEAECVSGTNNFYVFEKMDDNYKAFSLTVMPLGAAVMHFKYKKDAVYMAKKLHSSGIDFNREYIKLAKDEKLKKLIFNIREEINAESSFIRAGRLQNFPISEKKKSNNNKKSVNDIINSNFSKKEQEVFKEIVGEDMVKFLSPELLQVGVVNLDIYKIDEYLGVPDGVSMGEFVNDKFGKEKRDVFEKICCAVK